MNKNKIASPKAIYIFSVLSLLLAFPFFFFFFGNAETAYIMNFRPDLCFTSLCNGMCVHRGCMGSSVYIPNMYYTFSGPPCAVR